MRKNKNVQQPIAVTLKLHRTLNAEQTMTPGTFPPAALSLTRSMGSSMGSRSFCFVFLFHVLYCLGPSQVCFVGS